MPPLAPPAPNHPGEVCTALGLDWLASDTRTDTTPADARARAAQRWGTPHLAEQLHGQPPRPSQQWRELSAHRARIVTTAVPYIGEAPPPPSSAETFAAATISRQALGEDGWTQPLGEITVYCTLSRPDAGTWRVDAVQTSTGGD